MTTRIVPCVLLGAICSLSLAGHAQDQTIVSLPFAGGQTAGPRIQDYPPAQDSMDLWGVEDFTITRPWYISQFSSQGSGIGTPTDVVAIILDGLPPNGHVVMQSTPGTGHVISGTWGTYYTGFSHQRLNPGSYYIMWTVQGDASQLLPVFWVQAGPYAVGQGAPNTSYQYNPGHGWNWPEGTLRTVLDGLGHTGNPTGINFTITGRPAPVCGSADFNHDGDGGTDADIEAFFACIAGSCCATCDSADFNYDGDSATDADIEAFFRVLAGGAC
jgi:hypothetical protein